ncbi:MAG TPA: cobalamin-independent methionine synthase II family protein [Chloroflexota bacterium]
MKRSTQTRILTSHTGALPRPRDLVDMLAARDERRPFDADALQARVNEAVRDVVQHQADIGLTVINDGEHSKFSFWSYLKDRLTGLEMVDGAGSLFGGTTIFGGTSGAREALDFPNYFARRPALDRFARAAEGPPRRLCCTGPLEWRDFDATLADIESLKVAARDVPHADLFMTASSPGNLFQKVPNHYYPSDDEYLQAIADVLRREYRAIVEAGIVLQLDAPDLASRSGGDPANFSLQQFRIDIARAIEALNYATADLPSDMMRVHVCWGSDERPHNRDNELRDIVDILLTAHPAGLTLVAANGRHEFEWQVWRDVKLPEGKVLMAGVIDSTTNIIEHPETVAERILRFASVVGAENLIAGVDCGFQTSAGRDQVDPDIAWAKLASLAEGARRASERLGRVSIDRLRSTRR